MGRAFFKPFSLFHVLSDFFHCSLIEFIHPFIDGNGRTGRLLMNLQLIRAGLPPINVKFTDRRRYYDAFDNYARNNSAEAMITLVAEYVVERMAEMVEILYFCPQ